MSNENEFERVTIDVMLRKGESVRLASGGNFIRIDVTAEGVDQVKAKAIRDACAAGVITPEEERAKLVELGLYVASAHIWTVDELDRMLGPRGSLLSRGAENMLDEVRARMKMLS